MINTLSYRSLTPQKIFKLGGKKGVVLYENNAKYLLCIHLHRHQCVVVASNQSLLLSSPHMRVHRLVPFYPEWYKPDRLLRVLLLLLPIYLSLYPSDHCSGSPIWLPCSSTGICVEGSLYNDLSLISKPCSSANALHTALVPSVNAS